MRRPRWLGLFATVLVAASGTSMARDTPIPDTAHDDLVGHYDWVRPHADFVRREVMIPMRDGAHLHTVIVFRKGTRDAPILLSRTPYGADAATSRKRSQRVADILPIADAAFVDDGYIRVYQDVRGLGRSEGRYVLARPLRGPLNASDVDHATDAYDTIDWLVDHVPESNRRVGITGSSYLGFTALMALIDPHPALKAAVPQSPLVDGWIGDDWFHNGAFRTFAFDFLLGLTVSRGGGAVPRGHGDDYTAHLDAGSAQQYADTYGLSDLPAIRRLLDHPSYDAWWRGQALDKLLGARPLKVPTMLVGAQWDQEDSYGATAVYAALRSHNLSADQLRLVIGPWRHSQMNADARGLGPLRWEGDTAAQFRERMMKPFLDCHLKTRAPPCAGAPVTTYATGADRWEETPSWPAGVESLLYLDREGRLSWSHPAAGHDRYVADPARPVPMLPRPIHLQGETWRNWLVQDQRFVNGRTDVLSYMTPPLVHALHVRGAPGVELHAATSGRDGDFVVKLIDVYPEEYGRDPELAGYQLPLGIEIFRGRYVHGFSTPAPLDPGKPYTFRWSLPSINHVFQPGHRIMVQVQSSLFPLYDRNPQTWVSSIMSAQADQYRKATVTVHRGGAMASAIHLPLVE